ncbi:MAG: NAD+ synthase [Chloroflexota bacterium]|nr:NAD+ synthase [Chloroflexota bacterium]
MPDTYVAQPFRLALAQVNSTVGDLAGNRDRIVKTIGQAEQAGAELVAFPELALTGYPPEDLLLKPAFIRDNLDALQEIAEHTGDVVAVVGCIDRQDDIFNAAAVLYRGRVVHLYHKQFLPTYGVFDEDRYFRPGRDAPVFRLGDVVLGVNICEDIWYAVGPTNAQALAGAEVIVNINASPFSDQKPAFRKKMLATRAADNHAIVAYVNMVGGQDELVFDGSSLVFDPGGELLCQGRAFEDDLLLVDLDVAGVFRERLHDPRRRKGHLRREADRPAQVIDIDSQRRTLRGRQPLPSREPVCDLEPVEEIYRALVLGTRDYLCKTGFRQVVVGLSGGIDSSLVATIAVDAIGADNVLGVSMPSRYSSPGSRDDASELARALGIQYQSVPIEDAFSAMLGMLAPVFAGREPDIAEENLQARIRGQILMAISNKFGSLVLTTGNKSEMAVGYATLYGDMAGGFAVIKDVLKTRVYDLCRYRNSLGPRPVIPEAVLTKPPSAELRPDQVDQDSLPAYDVLDAILVAYVEEDRSLDEIVRLGFPHDLVKRVVRMVDLNEYKRRQAPPGVKVTARAFGRDRRLPIVNRYRDF